jgi:hypothetical protein
VPEGDIRKEADMEIPNKVLYALVAAVLLVTFSVRVQSANRMDNASNSEDETYAEEPTSTMVRRTPPPPTVIVYSRRVDEDEEQEPSTGSRLSGQSLIPHTTIGQTLPHEIVTDDQDGDIDEPSMDEVLMDDEYLDDPEDLAYEDDYDYGYEESVPNPDVNPWGSSDQQTFNDIVSVMSDDEAATFRSLWLIASPEERQELLLRARLGMLGG